MTESTVFGFATGCLFLVTGAFALFGARGIQRFALAYYARNPEVAQLNLFARYMASKAYVVVTRIIGLIIFVAGACCILLVLRA
jgi:hypothetical protein